MGMTFVISYRSSNQEEVQEVVFLETRDFQQKSYKKVIEYIKKQIMAGELSIGEKLPAERELSEMIGISRNSVREAIRTLDVMGVISSQHGAGNYVTGNFENNLVESLSMAFLLNRINYRQISELRRALEMQALSLAIDNITSQEIRQLEEIASQLEKTTEPNNVILDKKLHYNIALASRNTLIISILQALSEVIDQFIIDLRREILNSSSREGLMEAHSKMIRSVVTRNRALAYEAITAHFNIIDEKLREKP
jgi:GntR family transcriptional repressor for pyruvate dehydrogenase complex